MIYQYLIFHLAFYLINSFSFKEKEIIGVAKNKKVIIQDIRIEIKEKKFNGFFPDSIQISFRTPKINKTIVLQKSDPGSKKHPLINDWILNSEHNEDMDNDMFDLANKIAFYHDKNFTCSLTLIKFSIDNLKALGTCYDLNTVYSFLPVDMDHKRNKRSDLENPHIIIEKPKNLEQSFDFIKIGSGKKNEMVELKNLNFRENITNYVIEVLVVTDYSIYQNFKKLTRLQNKKALISYMKIYFSQMINEVNFKYLNSFKDHPELRISVKLKNFIFSTKSSDSKWSHRKRVGINEIPFYKQKEVVLADDTIMAFSEFMVGKKLNYTYDHAVGITSKDLWSSDQYLGSHERSLTSGMAFFGRICSPKFKFSIIEDNAILGGTTTLAHEIGHSIGSDHDGIQGLYKNCSASDGFIMSPSILISLNSNKFSKCSIEAIKNYMLKNSDVQCLTEADDYLKSKTVNFTKNSRLGTFWDLDEQCKAIFGMNASFCKDFGNDLCLNLYCRVNKSAEYCSSHGGALQGSICDSGKICVHSECVPDKKAINDDCPLGDDAIVKDYFTNESLTCENFIKSTIIKSNFSRNDCINNQWIKNKCCSTCKIYSKLTCLDKYTNCNELKDFCKLIDNIQLGCPKTCGICSTKITCQSDENLCKNEGVCKNITTENIKSFKCECTEGYSGEYCEERNPCIPNPCIRDQKCYRIGKKGFICS